MAGPVRSDGFISCWQCVGTTLRRPRRQLTRQRQSSVSDDARRSSSVLGQPSRVVFFCRLAGFNCFFFASCSSRHWAPSRELSNKLGLKKQRVVDVVTDAWLATAGLGGQILEACSLTCTASHNLSNSASAGPQGSVHRVDWAAEGRKSLIVPDSPPPGHGLEAFRLPLFSPAESQPQLGRRCSTPHDVHTKGAALLVKRSRRCNLTTLWRARCTRERSRARYETGEGSLLDIQCH